MYTANFIFDEFDAHKYCPNVTPGWDGDFETLFLPSERNKKILDVGCGNEGTFLLQGPNIYGIDPNLGMYRFLGNGKDYGSAEIAVPERAFRAFAEYIPFQDGEFDYVFSIKAVGFYPRHINFRKATREMLRVAKKDVGIVLIHLGGEMQGDILDPVLDELRSERYDVDLDGNVLSLKHPEYVQNLLTPQE